MKVYPTMLLKTNIEKMSVWGYATMSMKIKGLFCHSHDMYEKKGAWLKLSVENGEGACAQEHWGFAPSLALST